MMQCRLPDDSLGENHKTSALKSKRPSKIYDLNSHLLKMTKNPPVKDLQDWKISQKNENDHYYLTCILRSRISMS